MPAGAKRADALAVEAEIRRRHLDALTGLRRSEILRLTPDMIRDGHALLDAQTKSGKPRAVPLPPQAARIAQERLPWSVTAKTLRSAFEAARKAAGLPDVRFHDLRHTYASWLAQDGASMAMIRDLLGHASVQTTSRYAHLGRRDLIEATRRVGDRLGSGIARLSASHSPGHRQVPPGRRSRRLR